MKICRSINLYKLRKKVMFRTLQVFTMSLFVGRKLVEYLRKNVQKFVAILSLCYSFFAVFCNPFFAVLNNPLSAIVRTVQGSFANIFNNKEVRVEIHRTSLSKILKTFVTLFN